MENNEDKTGHFDINGNWVLESETAKLRNKLGPFWTLVDILIRQKEDNNKDLSELIDNCLERCIENRPKIIEHIKNIEND